MKKVGNLLEEGITKYQEGCRFNVTNEGLQLFLYFNRPTKQEIEDCKKGKLTFNFIKLDSVIFFLAKIGNMSTIDCPYSVHLSKELTQIMHPRENEGLSLIIFLVNAQNGILEAMRMVVLGQKFSQALIETIQTQGNEIFNELQYDIDIKNIYDKYSNKQLEKMSKYYFKVDGSK